ncbi:DUF6588 family protein [Roseivirga sp.]|uniref:DUF6588 family protein n=1 Tax=Roseivirga sp. TaxID=1964215 RepID=UPI003B8D2A39
MKRFFQVLFAFFLIVGVSKKSYSQIDFDSFLEAGVGDANRLLELYMQPVFEGLGYGMNSGWYNTAKPHKFLGFDISASLSMARVPDSRQFFTFENSDYTNVFYGQGTSVRTPTLFGPNLGADELPELSFRDFDDIDNDGDTMEELIRISAPTGLGIDNDLPFNAVPTPMAQIGIGLFKGTEVKLRYLPEVALGDDGNVNMFGIGIMHDITSYFPAEKLIPIDLSIFAGYTNLTTEVFVNDEKTQSAKFDASSWVLQVVASKKIAFLTVFGGLGYSNYDVDFAMLGSYNTESGTLVDPIGFNFKDNGIRTNVGLRLKLLFLTLTGEYALQEYNTLTAGVGISIR